MEEFQGMGDYQVADDKNRKIKTIIVASVAALIVVIVAIWGIISIVSSVNKKSAETTSDSTTAVVEEKAESVAEKQGELSPADQYTAQVEDSPVVAETVATTTATPAVESTPNTGPEDMVLTALLMGAATTLLLTNLSFKKQIA